MDRHDKGDCVFYYSSRYSSLRMPPPKFPLSPLIVIARPVNYIRNILCILLLVTILKQCVLIWNDCALAHGSHTDTSYAANSTLGVGCVTSLAFNTDRIVVRRNICGIQDRISTISVPNTCGQSDRTRHQRSLAAVLVRRSSHASEVEDKLCSGPRISACLAGASDCTTGIFEFILIHCPYHRRRCGLGYTVASRADTENGLCNPPIAGLTTRRSGILRQYREVGHSLARALW